MKIQPGRGIVLSLALCLALSPMEGAAGFSWGARYLVRSGTLSSFDQQALAAVPLTLQEHFPLHKKHAPPALSSICNDMWEAWEGIRTSAEMTAWVLDWQHTIVDLVKIRGSELEESKGKWVDWLEAALHVYQGLPGKEGLVPLALENMAVVISRKSYPYRSNWHRCVYVDEQGRIVVHEEFLIWLHRHTRSDAEAILYLAYVLGHENVERTSGEGRRLPHEEALQRFEHSRSVEKALIQNAESYLPDLRDSAKAMPDWWKNKVEREREWHDAARYLRNRLRRQRKEDRTSLQLHRLMEIVVTFKTYLFDKALRHGRMGVKTFDELLLDAAAYVPGIGFYNVELTNLFRSIISSPSFQIGDADQAALLLEQVQSVLMKIGELYRWHGYIPNEKLFRSALEDHFRTKLSQEREILQQFSDQVISMLHLSVPQDGSNLLRFSA